MKGGDYTESLDKMSKLQLLTDGIGKLTTRVEESNTKYKATVGEIQDAVIKVGDRIDKINSDKINLMSELSIAKAQAEKGSKAAAEELEKKLAEFKEQQLALQKEKGPATEKARERAQETLRKEMAQLVQRAYDEYDKNVKNILMKLQLMNLNGLDNELNSLQTNVNSLLPVEELNPDAKTFFPADDLAAAGADADADANNPNFFKGGYTFGRSKRRGKKRRKRTKKSRKKGSNKK